MSVDVFVVAAVPSFTTNGVGADVCIRRTTYTTWRVGCLVYAYIYNNNIMRRRRRGEESIC